WRFPMAVPGRRRIFSPALRRRAIPDSRRPSQAGGGALGAVSRATGARLSAHFEHRPHGGALAYADQNARGPDSGAPFAARVARDEPSRRQTARLSQSRSGGRRVSAWARAGRGTAADRDHGAGAGLYAVPFLRNQRK